jgi:hypothetical protein
MGPKVSNAFHYHTSNGRVRRMWSPPGMPSRTPARVEPCSFEQELVCANLSPRSYAQAYGRVRLVCPRWNDGSIKSSRGPQTRGTATVRIAAPSAAASSPRQGES